jgi:hypothetical protein
MSGVGSQIKLMHWNVFSDKRGISFYHENIVETDLSF